MSEKTNDDRLQALFELQQAGVISSQTLLKAAGFKNVLHEDAVQISEMSSNISSLIAMGAKFDPGACVVASNHVNSTVQANGWNKIPYEELEDKVQMLEQMLVAVLSENKRLEREVESFRLSKLKK